MSAAKHAVVQAGKRPRVVALDFVAPRSRILQQVQALSWTVESKVPAMRRPLAGARRPSRGPRVIGGSTSQFLGLAELANAINGRRVNTLSRRIVLLAFRARFALQRLVSLARRLVSRAEVVIRALLFFGVAATLASFINLAAAPGRASNDTFVTVLVGIGAMFGSVLAIVFALSSFMQQNAADLYSSQFYEVYARDWREKLIFVSIACLTILSFGLAVLHDTATVPVRQDLLVHAICS